MEKGQVSMLFIIYLAISIAINFSIVELHN